MRIHHLSLCLIVLSASLLPALSIRTRTAATMRASTRQAVNASYNSQKFSNIFDAAVHFAAPYINGSVATNNQYTYNYYNISQFASSFEFNDPIWQYGAPIVGYDVTSQTQTASTDCSGFVSRVLAAVVPPGSSLSVYGQIVTQPNGNIKNFKTEQHPQPFPSAAEYAQMIINNQVFKGITWSQNVNGVVTSKDSFSNAQPGDVLAYGLSGDTTDTGHVMVIEQVQPLQQGKLNTAAWATDLTEFKNPGQQYYAVTVFDSSTFLHYKGVRNSTVPNGKPTGVGHGIVLVIADAKGAPIGFMLDSTFKVLYVSDVGYTGKQATGPVATLAVGRI